MDFTLHINPALPHQVEHGLWITEGLKNLGHKITPDADIHICSGPHFAKQSLLGLKTILLDRAFYHPEKSGKWKSMDWVSLGWMEADGGRRFNMGRDRKPPIIRDRPVSGGSIFLKDYAGRTEYADTLRLHPDEKRYKESLQSVLRKHRTAIGYQTTALVEAGLEGLEIICRDPANIMFKDNWLELLPYADWKYSEIQSGEALEHLLCHL